MIFRVTSATSQLWDQPRILSAISQAPEDRDKDTAILVERRGTAKGLWVIWRAWAIWWETCKVLCTSLAAALGAERSTSLGILAPVATLPQVGHRQLGHPATILASPHIPAPLISSQVVRPRHRILRVLPLSRLTQVAPRVSQEGHHSLRDLELMEDMLLRTTLRTLHLSRKRRALDTLATEEGLIHRLRPLDRSVSQERLLASPERIRPDNLDSRTPTRLMDLRASPAQTRMEASVTAMLLKTNPSTVTGREVHVNSYVVRLNYRILDHAAVRQAMKVPFLYQIP